MIVSQLIAKLQEMDPNIQVMVDITKPGADMFLFAGIESVEWAGADDDEFILIQINQPLEESCQN